MGNDRARTNGMRAVSIQAKEDNLLFLSAFFYWMQPNNSGMAVRVGIIGGRHGIHGEIAIGVTAPTPVEVEIVIVVIAITNKGMTGTGCICTYSCRC